MPTKKPHNRFSNDELIVAAAQLAVHEALMEHRRAGNPVAVWRDGKVVWIPPEEIPLEPPAGARVKAGIWSKRRRM